jgi:hypothetical protein
MRKANGLDYRGMRIRRGVLCLAMLLSISSVWASGVWAQERPNFSGLWRQDNERSQPQRKGEVTLKIEHHDPEFTVETTIVRSSGAPRHALQHSTTDGKVSVSTGADGDEFHTSIVWVGASLVLSVEEHEDGRIILSKETWTLIENGAALQRVRELTESGDRQTLIYLRQPPQSKGQPR